MPAPPTAFGFSDDPTRIRQAGREALSLALMDARNHTLHLAAQWDGAARGTGLQVPPGPGLVPPLWLLGHVGWFAEWWIARNPQRHLGATCPPDGIRLASVLPLADSWWHAHFLGNPDHAEAIWQLDLPGLDSVKAYLLQTLETTLDLLEKAPETDAGLYLFRLAVLHEDLQMQRLMAMAQILGIPLTVSEPLSRAARPPLWMPACQFALGGAATVPGFAIDNELPQHTIAVPAFEIDAQALRWAQYVEFVDDAGYDRADLWHPQGWAWLQAKAATEGRRGPRFVDQIGAASGAVHQTRFGKSIRVSAAQAVMHVTWWEADAWCRWAGRRLPSEVEWELAASAGASRGLVWGDVWEWTGTTFAPYPGYVPGPWRVASQAAFGVCKVARGAAFLTPERLKSSKFRYFLDPGQDEVFVGFRSCSL